MILNIIGGAIIFLIGILVGYHVGLEIFSRRYNGILDEYNEQITQITKEYNDMASMFEQPVGGKSDGRT